MGNKLTNAYGSTWLQDAQDLVGRKRVRIEIDGFGEEVDAALFVDGKQVCEVVMADGVDAALAELFEKYEAQTRKPAPAGWEARK